MVVTIDGPTASGKSSVARFIARQYGYRYLCSGLLYRALAYELLRQSGGVEAVCEQPDALRVAKILHSLEYVDTPETGPEIRMGSQRLSVSTLKAAAVDRAASLMSRCPYVRELLRAFQRNYAESGDVVVEGRDAGTVVFPYAECKLFLTASFDVRVQRWQQDQLALGNPCSWDQAYRAVAQRDERDIGREHAPLRIADGAIVIDSTELSYQQVLVRVAEVIEATKK